MKVEDGFYMRVVRYVSRWEWIELDQYRYTHYCPATPPEFRRVNCDQILHRKPDEHAQPE